MDDDFGRSVSNARLDTRIIGWILLGIVAVGGLGYLTVAFMMGPGKEIQRAGAAIERQVNQASQQYVATQVRSMRDQIARYETNTIEMLKLSKDETNGDIVSAMQAQQKSLVRFMRAQAKEVPADAIPADVADFLSSH